MKTRFVAGMLVIGLSLSLMPAWAADVKKSPATAGGVHIWELARNFRDGHGVPKDVNTAAKLFGQAVLDGNFLAFGDIMQLQEDDKTGQLTFSAERFFKEAAEKGNRNAQFILGRMYLEGDLVKPDAPKAQKWLSKAAVADDPTAQCLLGWLLHEGKPGVRRDVPASMMWLKRSAGNGDNIAREGLVKIYREGLGVPKSEQEAAKWQQAGK
jgi:TPR repeat protein